MNSQLLTQTFSFDRILKQLVKVSEQVIQKYMLYNSGLASSKLLPATHFCNFLKLSKPSYNIQNSLSNS